MKNFITLFVLLFFWFNANTQSQKELLMRARAGDEAALYKIYESYNLDSFKNIEDRVFLANMRMLKIRSYEILRGQYFQMLNGFWGGQKEGIIETTKKVPICNKKFSVIANISYVHSKYVSEPILEMLMKERALAERMMSIRQDLIGSSVNLVTNKLTSPIWSPTPYNSTEEEYKAISTNNIKAQEKGMERMANWAELIAGVYVAKSLDESYQTLQAEFLRDLPDNFGRELADMYDYEYNKHCNQDYTKQLYDDWFTKEYIEVSDKRFSKYKFDGYFDAGQNIDGYRVWIDGYYRPEDYGNLISQVIYSGRYYALKLALKRGLSLDLKNTDGLTGRQVLAKQGNGYVQNQMRELIREYESDPAAFRLTSPETDLSDFYEESDSLPNFDSPRNHLDNYRVQFMLNGPRVRSGQTIHIRANGSVFLGGVAGNSSVEGINGFEGYSAVKDIKHGALMYKVGKSDPWKALNTGGSLIMNKTGQMQFAINDKDYQNNSGSYNVQILSTYNSNLNSTRKKTTPKTTLKNDTIKSKSIKKDKELSNVKASKLISLNKKKAIALAKSHSYNYNGFAIIYYSNRLQDKEIKEIIDNLESLLKERKVNNPKIIFSNEIEDSLDSFSVYLNTVSMILDAPYDRFKREIEQVISYQLKYQTQKSKQKN